MDAPIPDSRLIEDQEEWLRRNALPENASDVTADQVESNARYEASSRYQESIHESIFADAEEEKTRKEKDRSKLLATWEGRTLAVLTADAVMADMPLLPLATTCDTVFCLAKSWEHFETEGDKRMELSLERFSQASVKEFLSVVEHQTKNSVSHSSNIALVEMVSADAIVDCCQMAHYLQNPLVLEATEEALIASIDTDNCLSLCELADQLNMPKLFERALSHLMDSVGNLQENSQLWDMFSPDLRDRCLAIQGAFQSSLHSQRSRLYFGSLDEYLAIFAERVQYYKERLAEAKENDDGTSAYTREKIEKQEARVRTLEIAFKEQRKMFASKGGIRPYKESGITVSS